MGKLLKDQGAVKPPKQMSAKQNTAVGSGCRPTPSKYKIMQSAPADPRTMGGRAPSGWLK